MIPQSTLVGVDIGWRVERSFHRFLGGIGGGAFKANKGSIFPFSAKRSAAAATGIQWTEHSQFNRVEGRAVAYAVREQYRTVEMPVASNSLDVDGSGNGKFTQWNYWYALNLGDIG